MFNAALRALGFRTAPRSSAAERREPSAASRTAGSDDRVADDWIEDLRRQVSRLEGQVDDLQSEIHDQRETHAEEMRRKDILIQGAMQQIAHLTEVAGLPPPSPELRQLEMPNASAAEAGGNGPSAKPGTATLEPEVEPPAQRPVATPSQQPTSRQPASRSGQRKSSENLSVPGWATIEVFEAARLPA